MRLWKLWRLGRYLSGVNIAFCLWMSSHFLVFLCKLHRVEIKNRSMVELLFFLLRLKLLALPISLSFLKKTVFNWNWSNVSTCFRSMSFLSCLSYLRWDTVQALLGLATWHYCIWSWSFFSGCCRFPSYIWGKGAFSLLSFNLLIVTLLFSLLTFLHLFLILQLKLELIKLSRRRVFFLVPYLIQYIVIMLISLCL